MCRDLCDELYKSCDYEAFPSYSSCMQGCGYDIERGADIETQLDCVLDRNYPLSPVYVRGEHIEQRCLPCSRPTADKNIEPLTDGIFEERSRMIGERTDFNQFMTRQVVCGEFSDRC